MSRITRIGLVGFLALSALFLVPSPASAAETGAINFTGTATVDSPGLGYPVTTPARILGFQFESDTCVGVTEGKKGSRADDACKIKTTANPAPPAARTSEVTGHCGLSTGKATGTITANGHSYTFSVTWTTSAGGTLVITGTVTKTSTGQTGTAGGEVTAVPTTGSCAAGTATGFTIVGNVAYDIS